MTTDTEHDETVEMLTARVASYREAADRTSENAYHLRAQGNDTAADYWQTVAADYAAWATTAQDDLDALVAA